MKNNPKRIPPSSHWEESPLNYQAITPLDGRNYHKISALSQYFSEFAINKQRFQIEIKYLIFLSAKKIAPHLNAAQIKKLLSLANSFNDNDQSNIREFEKQINHDVKAVEYYLSYELKKLQLDSLVPYIHFGLTSEDINNLSFQNNLKLFNQNYLTQLLKKYLYSLKNLAQKSHYPMLGRTHGQPAQVTTFAKELTVYLQRLNQQTQLLITSSFQGKISGAVGSYTDHFFAKPNINWPKILSKFISSLGLDPVLLTTQILPYDHLVSYFQHLHLLQSISIDLGKNLWHYISLGYVDQLNKKNEVGSSVMPQKINPIYLEGAEGGFEISNSLLEMYIRKLPQSRLQRDLSDSTIRRGFGVCLSYSCLSFQSMIEAIDRLLPNPHNLQKDLKDHFEILTSSIQTYLRSMGHHKAYELLSEKVKGQSLTKDQLLVLIKSLDLPPDQVKYLLSMSFENLTSPITKLTKQALKGI